MQDGIILEINLIRDYKLFKDLGKHTPVPEGCENICVHLIFDTKHTGCHQGYLVANRYVTNILVDSAYSIILLLSGFRLLVFLAELNGLKTRGTYISSAYS